MKKNKALIIAISCVVVAIIGVVVAMVATGKFAGMFGKGETKPAVKADTTVSTTVAPVNSRPKSAKPASMVAVEYSDYSELSAADVAAFGEKGFNTVTFILTAENSETVKTLIAEAQSANIYFGIKADASADTAYITDFIKANNVNFVILTGLNEAEAEKLTVIKDLSAEIKEIDALTEIGVEPMYAANAVGYLPELVKSALVNFIYITQTGIDDEAINDFTQAVLAWNEESCPLWFNINLSELSAIDAEKAGIIIDLIASSADTTMCKALSFYPYTDIVSANTPAAESVLNFIRTRETYLLDKEFEITNYTTTEITVEQSKISFIGTSSPAYELLCNGQVVETAEKTGDFSVECELEPGENTITFSHKDQTYTYKVTYSIKLLKSVSPSADVSVPGGMEVGVTVIALKGATVKVTFNGRTYTMSQSESVSTEDDSPDAESDFVYYTASLPTPASSSTAKDLGRFTVTATYSSLTETMNGAKIIVAAETPPPPPPPVEEPEPEPEPETSTDPEESTSGNGESSADTTPSGATNTTAGTTVNIGNSTETLERYSYTHNYGLGTEQICVITDDYVETYPGSTSHTYSVPDCSPLLKGTVDYIKSTVTLDGNETYYVLESGVKVPLLREERLASGFEGQVTHLEVRSGYRMPKNTVNVVSTTTYDDKTVIVLDMNRPVAFNAKLIGQSYSNYAPGRDVVVSSLNCTGLQLTFSDTSNASGEFSFIGSVLKDCRWSSSGSNATLTLNLAQRGKFYGFHYEYNDAGMLVITVNHKAPSLSGAVIMLDPGHGGVDGGAPCVVKATGFESEKHINLSIAMKIKELLEAEGATVIMTRTSDRWVCYTDRNNFVRERNPDMYISIHCDSSSSASATGTSAYYYRAYSQPLAKAVHNSIVEAYQSEIYGSGSDVRIDRGTNFYAFRVTRVEECPAILIEYGFVSNTGECEVLQNAHNRDVLAQATVDGIKDYIAGR